MRVAVAVLAFSVWAAPARAADRLDVILDWFVNPDHAPVLVAQAMGAYAAEGLDVRLVQPTDAAIGPKLVAAGHADIALTAEPQFLESVAAGLKLVRIGVLIDRPLSTLVALQDTGIRKLSDLRGKRIGYGSGEVERTMVDTMLQRAGVSPDDVQMVQIGEQLSVALLSGQAQAVSVYRNFEPLELQQHGRSTVGFDYETNGVPMFDELIFVASAGKTDTRLVRFLRATTRGLVFLHAHPDEGWRMIERAYPDLDDALNHAAYTATLPYFATSAVALDRARYDTFERFLYDHKLISAITPASSYTTDTP